MKEHGSYRPTTLMKHMKLFGGPELQGKKEKGKKKKCFEINVQPASVRRSKEKEKEEEDGEHLEPDGHQRTKLVLEKLLSWMMARQFPCPAWGSKRNKRQNSFTIYRKQWTTFKPSQGDTQGNEYTPVLVLVNK